MLNEGSGPRGWQDPEPLGDGHQVGKGSLCFLAALHALQCDGRVALGVQVKHRHPLARECETVCQVDGRGRLTDATLLVCKDNGPQGDLQECSG